MKNFLINFQNNTKENIKQNPNFAAHYITGSWLGFILIIAITTVCHWMGKEILTAVFSNLIGCTIIFIGLELLQKFFGGKNTFWKMLEGFISYIPIPLILSVTFPYFFNVI